jgi:hypothetical protein
VTSPRALLFGVAVLTISTLLTPRAHGCCAVHDLAHQMRIADQDVLVVWDSASRMEHFIRRADFRADGDAGAFGFLVPTPNIPQLAEADGRVFDRLSAAIEPKIVPQYELELSLFLGLLGRSGSSKGVSGEVRSIPVRVLSRAHVAGYDAVVLEADDAAALAAWLSQHGFDARPEITDWLTPYLAAHWKLTAFTFNPEPGEKPAGRLATPAIRMTFTAERPVFPYRVPSDNRSGGHLLRMYYVASERGDADLEGTSWAAETIFARPMGNDLAGLLKGAVPPQEKRSGELWLSVFDDQTWPSGDKDLYFKPAVDQASIVPDPVTVRKKVFFPLDVLLLLGMVVGLTRRRRRRTVTPASRD